MKNQLRITIIALLLSLGALPARAIDPPYQQQMERLSEIMGSLYFLQPLCGNSSTDWRAQVADLIALDQPDEDRRQRLAGAFNVGYTAYARPTGSRWTGSLGSIHSLALNEPLRLVVASRSVFNSFVRLPLDPVGLLYSFASSRGLKTLKSSSSLTSVVPFLRP